MKEIEEHVSRLCRSLRVDPALRDHIREELQEHLSEAVEHHVREGRSAEEALRRAIEEFGSVESIGEDLGTIHNQNLVSYLMHKAMSWREQTMKTEWKWNFVALVALIFVIGVQLILAYACLTFIFPRIHHAIDRAGLPLPAMFRFTLVVGEFLHHWRFAVLLILLAGYVPFEVFYKKEGKASVRLAIYAVACVVTTLFLAVVSFTALMPSQGLMPRASLAPSSALGIRSGTVAKRKLAEADILLAELSDACEREDWGVIRDDAHDLDVICQTFELTRRENLAAMAGTKETWNDELDDLIDRIWEDGRTLVQSARAEDLAGVQRNLEGLKTSFGELGKALGR